jgi:hypothetical protein
MSLGLGSNRQIMGAHIRADDTRLLLNKSCVDQRFSSTVAVNENPPTGIEFGLDLLYILGGLAEKMFQLIGHALEEDWAIWRGRPGTVIVLNVDNNVESCGVLPRVKLKFIGSSWHSYNSRSRITFCGASLLVGSWHIGNIFGKVQAGA